MKVSFITRARIAGSILAAVITLLASLAGCNVASPSEQVQPAQVQPSTTIPTQTASQNSSLTPVPTTPSQLVRQADFGAWSYSAYKDGSGVPAYFGGISINYGDIEAHVKLDTNSVAGVSS